MHQNRVQAEVLEGEKCGSSSKEDGLDNLLERMCDVERRAGIRAMRSVSDDEEPGKVIDVGRGER